MAISKPGPDDGDRIDTATDESLSSTMEFIAAARRPLLIQRHRAHVEEMEGSLSDAMVAGTHDNERLQAMLKVIDSESEQDRVRKTLRTLSEDANYKEANLRDALIEELCLLREGGSVELATLQMHVMGLYRLVRAHFLERLGEAPSLAELRPTPVAMVARLLVPVPPEFGSPRLGASQTYTPAFADRSMATVKRLRKGVAGDQHWQESTGDPVLPRELEEPLEGLPDAERKAARALLVRDRIRSKFYRDVFLVYLDVNELDPKEYDAYPTLIRWLESVEATPHLYTFMQGQSTAQKIYRLSQLQQKLIQIHEMYARVALASDHPTYRDQFVGKGFRERLAILAKSHFPPLPLTQELALSAMLCPFKAFAEWVQKRLDEKEFVLPPDPKK
ncbi:MAG: hypothetical protein H0W72_04530 [Planctomycetes bacterium]|nr:hypothetical protein [Planctomycetota bacterium]